MRVEIKSGKGRTYNYRSELKRFGCRWNALDKCWYLETADNALGQKLIDFGNKKRLSVKVFEEGYVRNKTYRKDFLDTLSPNDYICSYCGKRLTLAEVNVDHIVSVASVEDGSRRERAIKQLNKRDIHDVNDKANLTVACPRCNKRKWSKGGVWVLRGFWGKKNARWWFQFRQVLLAVLIVLIILIISIFVLGE